MGRHSNNAGAQAPVTPADAVVTETPESGVIPPQGGTVTAPDTGTETPPGDNPEGKVKVKHEILKGKKLTLPSGEIAAFDENGILETDKETAEYLLSIPGYEKG